MRWSRSESTSTPKAVDGPASHQTLWGKIFTTAEAVADVAGSAILVRRPVRPLELAAIGSKLFAASLKMYSVWSAMDPLDYGAAFSTWATVPTEIARIALVDVDLNAKPIPGWCATRGGRIVEAAWTASVGGTEIGWCGPADQRVVPAHVWTRDLAVIEARAAEELWRAGGDRRMVELGPKLAAKAYRVLPAVVVTANELATAARLSAYLDARVPVATIFDGEPGTGKTTLAMRIAAAHGLRSILIAAEALTRDFDGDAPRNTRVVELMQPEALIIDDIHTLEPLYQERLHRFLDDAKTYAKLVIATSNRVESLTTAVSRPGRFDEDPITIGGLTREEATRVCPEIGSAAHVDDWPLSYVLELRRRLQVFGASAIEREAAALAQRLAASRRGSTLQSGELRE